MDVIAIDPAYSRGNRTGIAVFEDWHVVETYAVTGVQSVKDVIRGRGLPILIEVPRIYPHGGKGDPNQIVDLAFAAGRMVGGRNFEAVHPRTWKGTVKKEIMLSRIESRLAPRELALLEELNLTERHNALDAIGIGLWKLGRL